MTKKKSKKAARSLCYMQIAGRSREVLASFVTVKRNQGPLNTHDDTRDALCLLRTQANCRCGVSSERPLITSRPSARSYAFRERKL